MEDSNSLVRGPLHFRVNLEEYKILNSHPDKGAPASDFNLGGAGGHYTDRARLCRPEPKKGVVLRALKANSPFSQYLHPARMQNVGLWALFRGFGQFVSVLLGSRYLSSNRGFGSDPPVVLSALYGDIGGRVALLRGCMWTI